MTGTQLCSGPPELEQKQWRYIDMPNLGLYCTAKSIHKNVGKTCSWIFNTRIPIVLNVRYFMKKFEVSSALTS